MNIVFDMYFYVPRHGYGFELAICVFGIARARAATAGS